MWKWLILVVLLLGSVAGGGYYVAANSSGEKGWIGRFRSEPEPQRVIVEPVTRGDLARTISAPGSIEPRTKVEISAQVSARVTALPFREGAQVRRGDVVVRLDARDLEASLDSARATKRSEEARLDGARAAMILAEAERERVRQLLESGDASRSAMEAAEAEYLRAQSNLRMAQHAIEIATANIQRAEKDLENSVITSPMDGTVTRLQAEIGELVVVGTLNNPASVIMEIADLSTMLMRARVDESNIGPVRAGQHATVYINAYPGREFRGTVERVKLTRELDRDNTGYFETEILLDLADGEELYSGLTANCDIEVERFHDVLRIPSQAVVDRRVDELPARIVEGNPHVDRGRAFTRVVYRAVDGKAVATPVSAGPSDLTHTVILGGLDEGEKIVTGPYRALLELRDGHDIAPERAEADDGNNDP